MTDHDDAEMTLCFEYVMKYSLTDIRASHSQLNQTCAKYIAKKEDFEKYLGDKRKTVRSLLESDGAKTTPNAEDGGGGHQSLGNRRV